MIATIRRAAAAAILASALLALGPAQAAAPPHLGQLTIRLWPEFDQPAVLVFLVGQTAQGTPLPAQLTFNLPPGAQVNAVAYLDPSGNLLNMQDTLSGQSLSVTTPNGSLHIEFYDTLPISGAARDYRFTWQQPIAVDALSWEVEQPAASTGFQVEPTGTIGADENRLPVTQIQSGAVDANQAVSVHLSYTNSTGTLSHDALSTAQAAAPPAAQPAGPSNASLLIAVVIMALAVVISAAMYFRSTRPARVSAEPAKKAAGRFCPQCGQAARPGDQFCRKCGTKLRT